MAQGHRAGWWLDRAWDCSPVPGHHSCLLLRGDHVDFNTEGRKRRDSTTLGPVPAPSPAWYLEATRCLALLAWQAARSPQEAKHLVHHVRVIDGLVAGPLHLLQELLLPPRLLLLLQLPLCVLTGQLGQALLRGGGDAASGSKPPVGSPLEPLQQPGQSPNLLGALLTAGKDRASGLSTLGHTSSSLTAQCRQMPGAEPETAHNKLRQ